MGVQLQPTNNVRSSGLRWLWPLLILALALGIIIPLKIRAADDTLVRLSVDGVQQSFSTDAKDVREVLRRAKVDTQAEDLIEPAVDSPINSEVFHINVFRAKPAVVIDGEREIEVKTPYQNPRLIAEKSARLEVYPEDDYKIDLIREFATSNGVGHKVTVDRAVPVVVEVDGQVLNLRTQAETVTDMLSEQGINLGPEDQLSIDKATPISPNLRVLVLRNGRQTVAIEEVINFTEEIIRDNNQPIGYREVRKAGSNGKKVVTYEIQFQAGREVGRQVVQSVTTLEPQNQVVVQGTAFAGGAGGVWESLRLCESGGDYAKNTGNGYYGAYQFSPSTWRSMGTGFDLPHQAPPAVQDQAAQRLQARAGWGQWPACARKLGLY